MLVVQKQNQKPKYVGPIERPPTERINGKKFNVGNTSNLFESFGRLQIAG